MKIVNIMGGLGNQMFQYAFACTLKEANPKERVLIDTHHYKYNGYKIHQGFEINTIFPNASLPVASRKEIAKLSYYMPNFWLSRVMRKVFPVRKTEYFQNFHYKYYPEVFSMEGDIYFDGYWQSYEYFKDYKDVLLKTYAHGTPNDYNKQMISNLKGCNSVGMHVRRGDYKTSPQFYGICNLEYYKKAIEVVQSKVEKPNYFIFSDDINWCKENITPLLNRAEVTFVTDNKGANSCWDMFLMTHCKNLIIANSSFSWWGAFLNQNNGVIISPTHWVNRDEEQETPADNWIQIQK